MRSAYLTIDDSASTRMDDLVSYLHGKSIPAVFYCRGDKLEENPMAAVNAVKKGFILVNHTHTHQRASEQTVEFTIGEIRQCEFLLDRIYKEAKTPRSHKYFRYPHVDRGTGAWIIDYDSNPAIAAEVRNEIAGGVNAPDKGRPSTEAFAKKQLLQAYLKSEGFKNPFTDVTHKWFLAGEMGDAADSLFTFSNADWMLNERQKGKWPYKSVEDLKQKARTDKYLSEEGSVNVILAHDQADIVDVTIELIDDLAESGLKFLEV